MRASNQPDRTGRIGQHPLRELVAQDVQRVEDARGSDRIAPAIVARVELHIA
jgi:hypothetical protein